MEEFKIAARYTLYIAFCLINMLSTVCARAEMNPQEALRCVRSIQYYEQHYNIPKGLLHSIALIESGIWNHKLNQKHPWPWAVSVQGKAHYFQDKSSAISFVKDKQRSGIKNIDIGCAQLSLLHHGHNFPSLDVAFEPEYNTKYAAEFLQAKHLEAKNWIMAVGWYHSKTPDHYVPYIHKVHNTWHKLNNKRSYAPAQPTIKPVEIVNKPRPTSARKRSMRKENSLIYIKN